MTLDIDATSALKMLEERKISAVELLDEVTAHVAGNDGRLNSVVVKDFERARAVAAQIDDGRSQERGGRLAGLPVTIKESFDVAGLPTSWGVPFKADSVAQASALVVERLEHEGSVVLGKTNVPTFLDGLGSSNEVHGRTLNPLDRRASPGGSSSGSAVAIRAGFSFLDIGSDLSGSIRHPASFCGVFGHMPSKGLVPSRGHSLFGRVAPLDMSTPGPIARSARDLALAMDVLAGPDEDLSPSLTARLAAPRHGAFSDYRILVLDRHPLVPTDAEVSSAIADFAGLLASKGAMVADGISMVPSLRSSTLNYMRLLGAALSTGQDAETRARLTILDRQRGAEDDMQCSFIHGSVFSHSEWIDAQEARLQFRWRWKEIFRDFDVILCPVAPVVGMTHDEVEAGTVIIDGKAVPADDLIAWAAIAKSADLPATVMPFKTSRRGLPIGVQLIGPFMEDLTAIHFASLAGEQGLAPAYSNVVFPPYR